MMMSMENFSCVLIIGFFVYVMVVTLAVAYVLQGLTTVWNMAVPAMAYVLQRLITAWNIAVPATAYVPQGLITVWNTAVPVIGALLL
jgi:hypothetical protein